MPYISIRRSCSCILHHDRRNTTYPTRPATLVWKVWVQYLKAVLEPVLTVTGSAWFGEYRGMRTDVLCLVHLSPRDEVTAYGASRRFTVVLKSVIGYQNTLPIRIASPQAHSKF